jgi:hypothetical protein
MSTAGVLAIHMEHRITLKAGFRNHFFQKLMIKQISKTADGAICLYLSIGNFEKFFADGTCPEKLLNDKFLK